MKKTIVFSDFDGTITLHDTFVDLLKKFSTPGLADRLMAQMYAQTLTLRKGVTQLLESIPSDQYLNIIEFSKTHPIRSGFPEFLDFLELHDVPCVVVSGGIRIMVETVLEEFKPRLAGLHAVDLDASGDYFNVIPNYAGETELVAKVNIMAKYEFDQSIAIGDSITDFNMAMAADLVFARDRLAKYLDEQGKSYVPWNDFFEIRDYLDQYWSDTGANNS
ncbi:MAG: HAD-IB family phosphatase [Alkalinema sp. FL-bin-369]|nr:HAD-IB family phosphatase [Leptolyngbyaceae cyanobacterium LF-bin-369]